MITILCFLFMALVFGKLGFFAMKATWGLTKILVSLVFLPVMILGFILSGLFVFAIPLLILVGIGTLLASA